MKKATDTYKLVKIDWWDSFSAPQGWAFNTPENKITIDLCESVGWLVDEAHGDGGYVTLAQTLTCVGTEHEAFLNRVSIPKCSIVSVVDLSEGLPYDLASVVGDPGDSSETTDQ